MMTASTIQPHPAAADVPGFDDSRWARRVGARSRSAACDSSRSGSVIVTAVAVVLGEQGLQRGLVLYPGTDLPGPSARGSRASPLPSPTGL